MKRTAMALLVFAACAAAAVPSAPEIDPGAGSSAFATLAATVLILRNRSAKRKR